MNVKRLSLIILVIMCVLIEVYSLQNLYANIEFDDGSAPLFAGNVYAAYNDGFAYHAYQRTEKALNLTAMTSTRSTERFERYNEYKAIFEVFENTGAVLDNETTLGVGVSHGAINSTTSAIHFFLWVTNGTGRTEINYVIGLREPDFEAGENFVTFPSLNLTSQIATLHPWQDLVAVNRTQEGSIRIIRMGVRLIDYSWAEPGNLSLTEEVDLSNSYLLTSYGKGANMALYDYQVQLSYLGVIAGAAFLMSLALILLLDRRSKTRREDASADSQRELAASISEGDKKSIQLHKFRSILHSSHTFVVLMGVSVLSRIPFLLATPLLSDYSQYTYFAFALARGEIPYKDLVLPHPPLGYEIYSLPARVFGNNLIALTMFSTVLFGVSTVLCYAIAKRIFGANRKYLAFLSALLFALWPATFVQAFTSPLEVVLTVFLLAGLYFFVYYKQTNEAKYMIVSGAIFGASIFVKPAALFMMLSVLIFELVSLLRGKKLSILVKDLKLFIIGSMLFAVAGLIWITFVWGVFDQFLFQAIAFQTSIKDPLLPFERIIHIKWIVIAYLPLIVLSATSLVMRKIERKAFGLTSLPAIVALVSMFVEIVLFDTLFHHMFYLTPLFCIASLDGIGRIKFHLVHWVKKAKPLKPTVLLMLFVVSTAFTGYAVYAVREPSTVLPTWKSPWTPEVFEVSNVTITAKIVGEKVAALSNPNDRIFVGDGAIAFFADRLIEVPDLEGWPVQVFYETWFQESATGIPKIGLLEPSQFTSSWEKQQTNVLVFIRGYGSIIYPDELLWNGYPRHQGVADYVVQNYIQVFSIKNKESGYTYEIWVRKT